MNKPHIPLAITLGLMASTPSILWAQGYQIDELSARRLGDGFSGGAADVADASTAYYNPAGLSYLKQQEWVVGVSTLDVDTAFSGTGLSVDSGGLSPIQGQSNPISSTDTTPHFFVAIPANTHTTYGFSVVVPFASGNDFGKDFIGRYQSTRSEILGLRLSASVGTQLNQNWSLGFGAGIQRMEGTIESAINAAGICSIAEENLQLSGLPDCAGLGYSKPGTVNDDGHVKVTGNNNDFFYYLGAMYALNDDTRFGVSYHARVEQRLSGDIAYTFPEHTQPVLKEINPALTTNTSAGSLALTTPETASLSAFHRITTAWSIQATATWTAWHHFEELRIESQAQVPDIVETQNWDDSWRYAIGTAFNLDDSTRLRFGVARDESPIPDNNLSVGFPYSTWHALSVGISLAVSDALLIDAGVQRTFDFDAMIDESNLEQQASVLQGEMTTGANSFALGINWRL